MLLNVLYWILSYFLKKSNNRYIKYKENYEYKCYILGVSALNNEINLANS